MDGPSPPPPPPDAWTHTFPSALMYGSPSPGPSSLHPAPLPLQVLHPFTSSPSLSGSSSHHYILSLSSLLFFKPPSLFPFIQILHLFPFFPHFPFLFCPSDPSPLLPLPFLAHHSSSSFSSFSPSPPTLILDANLQLPLPVLQSITSPFLASPPHILHITGLRFTPFYRLTPSSSPSLRPFLPSFLHLCIPFKLPSNLRLPLPLYPFLTS